MTRSTSSTCRLGCHGAIADSIETFYNVRTSALLGFVHADAAFIGETMAASAEVGAARASSPSERSLTSTIR